MECTRFPLPFALYQAGAIAEVREMRRDSSLYTADHWNAVDLLGLGLVAGGLAVRIADETSPWGRGFYALSAPLLFSRVLFFAQMLRFQGPMVQASSICDDSEACLVLFLSPNSVVCSVAKAPTSREHPFCVCGWVKVLPLLANCPSS